MVYDSPERTQLLKRHGWYSSPNLTQYGYNNQGEEDTFYSQFLILVPRLLCLNESANLS